MFDTSVFPVAAAPATAVIVTETSAEIALVDDRRHSGEKHLLLVTKMRLYDAYSALIGNRTFRITAGLALRYK